MGSEWGCDATRTPNEVAMSDESLNTGLPVPSNRHKFPLGHKFGRGNPMGRATGLFRAQIVKELKSGRRIPRLIRRLVHLSNGAVPVRLRVKKKEEATGAEATVQETVWVPVDPAVQLNAIKELLSRGVGKATEFKVIEDNRAASSPPASIEEWVERLTRLGLPVESWPLVIREAHRRKKVEGRVIEEPKET
jgi:hypothetical protein